MLLLMTNFNGKHKKTELLKNLTKTALNISIVNSHDRVLQSEILQVLCKNFPIRIQLKTTNQIHLWQNFKTCGKSDHDPVKIRSLSVQLAIR